MSNLTAESWVSSAQSELFRGWPRWTSFACIWIWSCSSGLLSFKSDIAQQLTGILAVSNVIILLTTTVALFLALLFSGKIKTIIGSRLIMAVSGAVLSAGSILAGVGVLFDNLIFAVLGLAVGGIALAPLKIAWGEMFSKMTLRRGLLCMGYALIASMIVILLTSQFSQEVIASIAIASSVPCAHLAYIGTKQIDASPEKEKNPSDTIHFSLTLLLLPMMTALSYGFVKGLLPLLNPGDMTAVTTSTEYAELFVGILILVFAYNLKGNFGPAQVYSVALILVVTGLLLSASQSLPPQISFLIHDMGFMLFYFFMVVYWGDLSRRTGMPVVRIYTIGYFSFQGMNAFGTLLAYITIDGQAENAVVLVVIAIVLALFVVALLLFGDNRSSLRRWLIADNPTVEQGDEISPACSEIATNYSLSPREQEVLSLLARGRNASYVARVLYVSHDTAKTHIRNIYRKLNVHTQQDLIDIIEQTAADR